MLPQPRQSQAQQKQQSTVSRTSSFTNVASTSGPTTATVSSVTTAAVLGMSSSTTVGRTSTAATATVSRKRSSPITDLLPPKFLEHRPNIQIQATLTNSFDPVSGIELEEKSRNKTESERLIEDQGEEHGGHLRNIREVVFRNDKSFTVISAMCMPQMKLNEKVDYSVYLKIGPSPERKVLYDPEITICTCPSGKGWKAKNGNGMKYCKHIGALYLWINMERFESKTDKTQQWHSHSQHLQQRYPKV